MGDSVNASGECWIIKRGWRWVALEKNLSKTLTNKGNTQGKLPQPDLDH